MKNKVEKGNPEISEILFLQSLIASEERNLQWPSFHLSAKASAMASSSNQRRNIYRLRTLYLSLNEPQNVNFIDIDDHIEWAIMPTDNNIVTYSKLRLVELWDVSSLKKIHQIDINPIREIITILPYFIPSDGKYFEIVINEGGFINMIQAPNLGKYHYQIRDTKSGEIKESNSGLLLNPLNNNNIIGMPCATKVSVKKLEIARKTTSDFSSLLVAFSKDSSLGNIKGKLFEENRDEKTFESSDYWWIDSVDASGEYILATYYTENTFGETWNTFGKTWNGSNMRTIDDTLSPSISSGYVSVWKWDGQEYQRMFWYLKLSSKTVSLAYTQGMIESVTWGMSNYELPLAAGFENINGKTLLWSIESNLFVSIIDPEVGTLLRPPFKLKSYGWVNLYKQLELIIIERSGRLSFWDAYGDYDKKKEMGLGKLSYFERAITDKSGDILTIVSNLTNHIYEICIWSASNQKKAWNFVTTLSNESLCEAIQISESNKYISLLLRIVNSSDRKIFIFNKDSKKSIAVINIVTSINPIQHCSEGGLLQFVGNDSIVWCQGESYNWEIRKIKFIDKISNVNSVKNDYIENEEFLGFSEDGGSFLTYYDLYNYKEFRFRKINSNKKSFKPLRIISSTNSFKEFISFFFRKGNEWQFKNNELVGKGINSFNFIITGEGIKFYNSTKTWIVFDPTQSYSTDNKQWAVEKQEILSVDRSGHIIVTVNITANSGRDSYGNLVRLWDSNTGYPISQWLWHESNIIQANFNEDGWLCTLTGTGKTRLWPAETTELNSADWIDHIAEPISGVRLSEFGNMQQLNHSELAFSRKNLIEQLKNKASRGDKLSKWYLRRVI